MIPWEKIKSHWRNQFSQTEIYSDNNEHIIGFELSDNSVVLIGYLHYFDGFWTSARDFIDFINFIKKIGDETKHPSYKVIIQCNQHLSKIKKAKDIMSLPTDVEYYYVDYNSFYETIEFKLEDLNSAANASFEWAKINTPWHHKLGIEVITDSRFEDWDKWTFQGYKREWYKWNEDEKFAAYWGLSTGSFNLVSEIFIDERLLGFYLIWKYRERKVTKEKTKT